VSLLGPTNAIFERGTKRGRKSLKTLGHAGKMAARQVGASLKPRFPSTGFKGARAAYWQSARALAVHCPKPLATILRMTEQT
jgi:hypothetical protein